MSRTAPLLVDTASLPYLLSLPSAPAPPSGVWPLLCFLHGYDEGPPTGARQGLTRHGPLSPRSSSRAAEDFIVVAPHLPARGDLWGRVSDAVQEIVRQVQALHRGDPERTYLTGFSFGGNGVFDLALAQRDVWTALWPVDPTRVPAEDPGRPVWLSFGEVARYRKQGFIQRLQLEEAAATPEADRVYTDFGEDHVGAATSAYRDDRIYQWLLSKHRV